MSLPGIVAKAAAQSLPAVGRDVSAVADKTAGTLGQDAFKGTQQAAATATQAGSNPLWKAFDWAFTKVANAVSEREYGHPF